MKLGENSSAATCLRFWSWPRTSPPGTSPPYHDCARLGHLRKVSVVLEVMDARRKSKRRLKNANSWLMDREGAEQATRSTVAEYKAAKLRRQVGDDPIIDLCCGIGSDAAALAEGGPLIYVDRNPLRVMLARFNLAQCHLQHGQIHPLVATAESLPLPPYPLHLDPSRRQGSNRLHSYEDMIPGPQVIEELIDRHKSMALKCGPGIDAEKLPHGEVEWIQDGSDLVEATLWCGDLATGSRRSATIVDLDLTISGELQPLEQSSLKQPAFLHEPRPAIERSGLIGHLQSEISAGEWYPGLGWLAGDEQRTSPWFRSFSVVAQMGWHEKKIVEWFRQQGCAPASIKTRGVKEDPARLRRRFSGEAGEWILALLRRGQKIEACVLKELKRSDS